MSVASGAAEALTMADASSIAEDVGPSPTIQLTPRSKIKAMLDAVDEDSDLDSRDKEYSSNESSDPKTGVLNIIMRENARHQERQAAKVFLSDNDSEETPAQKECLAATKRTHTRE